MGGKARAKGAAGEVTVREASELTGIPVPTIREWIHRGKVAAKKRWGTRWFIRLDEVERVKNWTGEV